MEAWFTDSTEHIYLGNASELSFNVDLDEMHDELSIGHMVREMVYDASIARKRAVEVSERKLD